MKKERPNAEDIISLLKINNPDELHELYAKAYRIKTMSVGKKVYYRGIVEFSNVCKKNCYYCGIRKDNTRLKRFTLSKDEIVSSALWAYEQDYGSIVLQSGERDDAKFIDFIEDILLTLKEKTQGKLGITLSVGEQTDETYRRWFDAGAHRYLLRIETSSPQLYAKLHPPNHSWEKRRACLSSLRKIGYQTGTGVMIGLPFQTQADLAGDVIFFYDEDIDMIGMGPYIPHQDTPLCNALPEYSSENQLELALKMIAICRIYLKDVNIASTTALQALKHDGRELGLKAGANIIMPNITETKYREYYQLYDNKPCLDENASMCRNCLEARIKSIGEEIGYAEWGDSPHFQDKKK